MSKKKRLAVVLLGGNISTFYDKKTDAVFPMTKFFSIASHFSNISEEAEVDMIDGLLEKHEFLEVEDWEKLYDFIREKHQKYEGFVILQETDSLQVGSALIGMLCSELKKPIVFTMSIPPFLYPLDKTAENNLELAFRVALSDIGETVIVSKGRVVRAVRSKRYNILHSEGPMVSDGMDDVAKWEDGKLKLAIHRMRRNNDMAHFPFPYPHKKVHFFRIFPGFPIQCFENMLHLKHIEAVVVETLGYGSIRPDLLKVLENLAASGIHVIVIAEYDSVRRTFFLDADANIVRKKRMLLVKNMTLWTTFAKTHIALQNEKTHDFIAFMEKNLCGEIEENV